MPLLLMLAVSLPASAATSPVSPHTTNNNDSCDIAMQPAATLLLPYFEVDAKAPVSTATTTLFTVQNVSPMPQIANVTIWTDWSFPIGNFPIFLTGYDVQSINLYDILSGGFIGSRNGTSNATPVPENPAAIAQPAPNNANPHFAPSAALRCSPGSLPGLIPPGILRDLNELLTLGTASNSPICRNAAGVPQRVGGTHANAIGYLTIDVVATCDLKTPASPDYYTSMILFDNVLTGDYQHVIPRAEKSYALGGPLVHIRAVPEDSAAATSLPYTFYDRLTTAAPERTSDRRQPLPSTFAPRYIQGGAGGFTTSYRIWREAITAADAACATYNANGLMPLTDIIRFDEHENATLLASGVIMNPFPATPPLPSTSVVRTGGSPFPAGPLTDDVAGWMYLNLNNGGSNAYSVAAFASGIPRDFRTGTSTTKGPRQSQNWVITSMFAEPTYAIESPAVALGNGCTPSPAVTTQIAPAGGATP
ncbi:MAG: hypothetical protein QOI24_3618 [Acidobacteriota bacterium]|jgi:hypothetical protein|nr:hypothetical protein [Acidobacteriota bacterium]